jgi:hypothetical protein
LALKTSMWMSTPTDSAFVRVNRQTQLLNSEGAAPRQPQGPNTSGRACWATALWNCRWIGRNMARAPALEHDRNEGSFSGGFERTPQNSTGKRRSILQTANSRMVVIGNQFADAWQINPAISDGAATAPLPPISTDHLVRLPLHERLHPCLRPLQHRRRCPPRRDHAPRVSVEP